MQFKNKIVHNWIEDYLIDSNVLTLQFALASGVSYLDSCIKIRRRLSICLALLFIHVCKIIAADPLKLYKCSFFQSFWTAAMNNTRDIGCWWHHSWLIFLTYASEMWMRSTRFSYSCCQSCVVEVWWKYKVTSGHVKIKAIEQHLRWMDVTLLKLATKSILKIKIIIISDATAGAR